MADPQINIDLALRDAASVFARGKQDTAAGPQREAMRRRLLAFVQDYDKASVETGALDFVATAAFRSG